MIFMLTIFYMLTGSPNHPLNTSQHHPPLRTRRPLCCLLCIHLLRYHHHHSPLPPPSPIPCCIFYAGPNWPQQQQHSLCVYVYERALSLLLFSSFRYTHNLLSCIYFSVRPSFTQPPFFSTSVFVSYKNIYVHTQLVANIIVNIEIAYSNTSS